MGEEAGVAVGEVLRAVDLRRRRLPGQCLWSQDLDDDMWETSCKQAWVFPDGTPKDNGVKFCPFCGAAAEFCAQDDDDDDAEEE